MAEYYRTIFTIERKAKRGLDLLDDVFQCIRQWAVQEFGEPSLMDEEKGEWHSRKGTLRLDSRKLNASGLSSLVWRRENSTDPHSLWRLSLRLATNGEDVEADIEIQGIESKGMPVRPEFQARPPSFMKAVVDRFECRVGERLMKMNATPVPLSGADAFIKCELFRADRQMPLVVVSGRNADTFAKEANKLQAQLIGSARVFNYDHNTAWNIAKDLPRALRCYDGVVRLYSPGCSEDDVSQQHPYWTREDAEKLGEQFWKILRDECGNRVSRHGRRRLYAHVSSQIQQEETSKLEAKIDQLEQSTPESEKDTSDELLEMISDLLDDTDSVSEGRKSDILLKVARAQMNRAKNLFAKNEQLEREIEQLRSGAIQSGNSGITDNHSDENEEPSPSFGSILEAVEHADENLSCLRFFPNAYNTAKSRYTRTLDGHADKIYEALSVLNECAERRSKGGLGTNLQQWFSSRSIDFSDEAKATKREFTNNRRFEDDEFGGDILMTQHIKLLQNDIRIHVKWDKLNGKYLIGHIGEHLPTSRDPH